MIYQVLPPIALILAYLFLALRVTTDLRVSWPVPAALSLVFAVFSIIAIAQDGVLMFWFNHTENGVGNQVWFDLLMAVSMSMIFLVPKAQALNMRVGLWAIFVAATASIGLFAMLARIMYLQERAPASDMADAG